MDCVWVRCRGKEPSILGRTSCFERERERENCLILKFDKVGKAAFWAEILKLLFDGLNTQRTIYLN